MGLQGASNYYRGPLKTRLVFRGPLYFHKGHCRYWNPGVKSLSGFSLLRNMSLYLTRLGRPCIIPRHYSKESYSALRTETKA
jgi:hypothetical protein